MEGVADTPKRDGVSIVLRTDGSASDLLCPDAVLFEKTLLLVGSAAEPVGLVMGAVCCHAVDRHVGGRFNVCG